MMKRDLYTTLKDDVPVASAVQPGLLGGGGGGGGEVFPS